MRQYAGGRIDREEWWRKGNITYEAAAVPFDDQRVFSGFEFFRDEYADFDLVVADLLIWGCVDVKAVEACFHVCLGGG